MKGHSNAIEGTSPLLSASTDSVSPYSFWKDPLVWVLLVTAFAFRVLYNLYLHTDGHPPLDFVIDEREYFSAAHTFAEGRGFAFYNDFIWVRPPLYVLFLGFLFEVGGDYRYLGVLLVQALVSAVSLVPFGLLAVEVRGRSAARWTLGLGAAYLPFTLFAGLLVSETLFLFFIAFGLLALWKERQALVRDRVRKGYLWLVSAGLLLGCATLTRSTALVFVFVAALWLLFSLPRTWTLLRKLAAPALLVLVGLTTLLPWTVRNYAAYHRFIPVDTTGAYNLWLASLGVRDEARMQGELRRIEDQGERQDYAFARAWETISTDPARFVGKGLKEALDLWKPLLSAEENAVQGYPSGRVPAWHLALLLVFDNLLYVAILLLAVCGLALSKPPTPLKWLTGSWVVLWVVTSFVFFAVTRFRMPVVAALLPWAGVGITILPRLRDWRVTTLFMRISSAAAAIAIVLVVCLNVPLSDTLAGMDAWQRQAPYREGERRLGEDRLAEAIESYRRADINVADTRYGLAAALLQQGSPGEAMAVLKPAEPEGRYEPPILRGQAARMQGNLDSARSFFNARVVQVAGDEALRWAWDHLRPDDVQSLEVGSGLDVGYVRGFHGPERDTAGRSFRWSTDRAEVRGIAEGVCALVWSGWRPSPLPIARVILRRIAPQGNAPTQTIEMLLPDSVEWSTTELSLSQPATINSLELEVNPFVGSGRDPRLLGVQISGVDGCHR